MTIGIVADSLSRAPDRATVSAPDHIKRLALSLAELGHEVTIYARRTDSDAPERAPLADGVVVHTVTAGPPRPLPADRLRPYLAKFAQGLSTVWRVDAPEVIHAHRWTSALVALAGRGDTDIPVVRTFWPRASATRRSRRELVRLERAICRDVSHLTVGCNADVADLTALGTPRSKLTVVPRGVDLDEFTPDGPSSPRDARPRLLSLGPLTSAIGFDTAIRALRTVPDAELVLAAVPDDTADDPAEVRRLAAIARSAGVADRVQLLRLVSTDALPPLIRSSDLVVCVPRDDVAETLAPEAMACGKPVVATECGSLTDLVINDVTGMFVPPGEPEQVANAVRALLTDATRRDGYGMTARERVSARYSWPRVAEETARVYSGLAPSA